MDTWIIVGLISAAAWGLSCVIDVCFVGEGIYRKPVDGPLVAGIFYIVPLAVFGLPTTTFSATTSDVDPGIVAVASLSGIAYLLHIYFYFRALFALNDASNAEIFNTLSVLIVPVLAFVIIGEILEPMHYVALGLAMTAIAVLVSTQLLTLTWTVTLNLGLSVLFISLSMVLQAWVLQFVAYETAAWLFAAAIFLGVMGVLAVRAPTRRRIVRLCGRFGALFIGVELLEVVAVLGSQLATDIGPSVSLVALLECSLPVFVMLFSWLFFGLSRHVAVIDTETIRSALAKQTQAFPVKLISLTLIVYAIGLVH